MKLKDQHIFVTGGADGIGRAVVQDVADAGAKVSFCDLNVEKGRAYESELRAGGHRAFFVEGNVGSVAQMEAVHSAITKEFGDVQGLVNNA